MASCSSGLKRDVQKLGGGLSVFEAFGNHTEGERLHAGNRLITVGAIAHDPGQRRYFGQPPAIILAFELDGKCHAGTVAPGPAVQQFYASRMWGTPCFSARPANSRTAAAPLR